MLGRTLTKENMRVLGAVTYLCGFSPLHSVYTAAMIRRLFLPAIILNQYLLYESQHEPIAFCSWGFLSDQKLYQALNEKYILMPEDWQSGNHLFFPDFLAPFGHGKVVINDLRKLFVGRSANALRLKPLSGQNVAMRKAHYVNRTHLDLQKVMNDS
jgi:cytolysin-activating lysine-acyltransferase